MAGVRPKVVELRVGERLYDVELLPHNGGWKARWKQGGAREVWAKGDQKVVLEEAWMTAKRIDKEAGVR